MKRYLWVAAIFLLVLALLYGCSRLYTELTSTKNCDVATEGYSAYYYIEEFYFH